MNEQEQNRAAIRWRGNIWRTVAWLKAPSDEEDHASFQLYVMWLDGPERLPEVYALEVSNPGFEVTWSLLRTALTSAISILVAPALPEGTTRADGKVPVSMAVFRRPPPQRRRDECTP